MSLEFTSNIPVTVLDSIQEHVISGINWADVAQDISSYIDSDDVISNVSRYVMEELINDYVDYDKIVDQVSDNFDSMIADEVRSQINDIDVSEMANDQVEYLLSGYDPSNGCYTGKMFTEAVQKALIHVLENDDAFSNKIADLLKQEKKVDEAEVQEFVPLFNPDLIGVNSVVSAIADRYLSDQQTDPDFLVNLQMEMWGAFINARSAYEQMVKSNKGE